jgi:hypothetical protein
MIYSSHLYLRAVLSLYVCYTTYLGFPDHLSRRCWTRAIQELFSISRIITAILYTFRGDPRASAAQTRGRT